MSHKTTLGIVQRPGLPLEQVICDSEELPDQHSELAVVATDDVIFLHQNVAMVRPRLAAFDGELHRAAVPRATHKDIEAADQCVGLGCHLRGNPPRVDPDAGKAWDFVTGVWSLVDGRKATPLGVNSLLGLGQWFAILARPSFSCFHAIYRFVRREPTLEAIRVPISVCCEILTFSLLVPPLGAALDREWSTKAIATDAAPEFGFGVSVANLPQGEVARLGRKCERRGDHVRFDRMTNASLAPEKPRLGTPVPLPCVFTAFDDVISLKALRAEHSGLLELRGVRLGLRWALRSTSAFHKRHLMLIDAKAALSAVCKGRSGSYALRRPLASIGAHVMATGTLLRCLHVPSEDNPADGLSRGKRKRPSRRRVLKSHGHSKLDRKLHKHVTSLRPACELMRRDGMFSSSDSDSLLGSDSV